MWEFEACANGYAEAHGGGRRAPKLSDADYEALVKLGEKWNEEALGTKR